MQQKQVIVPLYIYPTESDFTAYLNYFSEYTDIFFHVVLNIDNGPGTDYNNDYIKAFNQLRNFQNVITYGYVYTNYTNRNINDVKNDINK